jgi:hypothetical protein
MKYIFDEKYINKSYRKITSERDNVKEKKLKKIDHETYLE